MTLLCVEWDVKPYTLTHSYIPFLSFLFLFHSLIIQDCPTPPLRAGAALPRLYLVPESRTA